MLRAVLFDWGHTLVDFEWSDDLLARGHAAGLAALGRAGDASGFTRRFRTLLPHLTPADDYRALLARELGVDAGGVHVFLDAEYEVWTTAHQLLATAPELLDALRDRGLALGVVANAWPEPGRLVRRRIAELGVAERVDTIVTSDDVGVRKPDPRIFEAALRAVGVAADEALFVGDRLVDDVRGAAEVGMTTVQALWFRADEDTGGIEPDFMAFTPTDVLNAVRGLAR